MRATRPPVVLSLLGVVALCGCAPHPGMPVHDTRASDLIGPTWTLDAVTSDGRSIEPRGVGDLVFSDDGTMHGTAGCHRFDARYTVQESAATTVTVRVTALAIAHTQCEALYGDQETAVFDVLGGGFEAAVVGDTLGVTSEGGASSLGYIAYGGD
jgi:heat shock protein HslJ